MKVIRVQKEDRAIARYIVEHFVEKQAGGPPPAQVHSLLADERTYLFAAMAGSGEVTGYALAYAFLRCTAPAAWLTCMILRWRKRTGTKVRAGC